MLDMHPNFGFQKAPIAQNGIIVQMHGTSSSHGKANLESQQKQEVTPLQMTVGLTTTQSCFKQMQRVLSLSPPEV